MFRSDAVLAVGKNHRFAKRKSISFAELDSEPMVLVSKEYMFYDQILQRCAEAGFVPQATFTSAQWDLLLEMVAENKGVTIICRPLVEKLYSGRGDKGIQVSVITFGFKRGLPLDADLVFDMRFLPNPFYIQSLRTSTGLDEEVSNYVLSFDAASEFLNNAEKMILSLAPHFLEQDKKQLVVGVGCTGGMHRSVAMGEELAKRLRDKGQRTSIEHRDLYLEKDAVTKRFLKAVRIDD